VWRHFLCPIRDTAYFEIRADERIYTIAMRALAEGNSLRGTGRIIGVDKDTICRYLDRGGRYCRAVTAYLFDNLHISECRLDELWSFVRKKEGHLAPTEEVLNLAMAAGITDHVWTMEELLCYRVPPDFRDALEQQEIAHNQHAFHTRY
jgi:hypothetical protein